MGANLIELAADIVIAHAGMNEMSSDELLTEIQRVYATLQALEKGEIPVDIAPLTEGPKKRGKKAKEPMEETAVEKVEGPATPPAPAMTISEAFKSDQVGCMICGKTGMKTLKRHLSTAHEIKPGKYRKMFNIPKDQPLAAMEYVEKRRQMALDRGLGEKLAAGRAARKSKKEEIQTVE